MLVITITLIMGVSGSVFMYFQKQTLEQGVFEKKSSHTKIIFPGKCNVKVGCLLANT